MGKIYALPLVVYFNAAVSGLHKKQPLLFLAKLMVYSRALTFAIALFH
ncbi:hypothetical protein [Citrobacter sp. Marseille-Q6884]|nr:hypothetical protein [Citrobacter sp. Marseille-Q6884]